MGAGISRFLLDWGHEAADIDGQAEEEIGLGVFRRADLSAS